MDEATDNVTVINVNPAEGEQQGEAFDINLEELTQGAEPGDFKQQQPGQQGSMVVYSTLEQQQSLDSTSSPPAPRSSSPSPPEEEAEGGEEAGAASPPELSSWVRDTYPSLHQVWHQTSGSSFFQGGVELLCSSCRQRPAAGEMQIDPIIATFPVTYLATSPTSCPDVHLHLFLNLFLHLIILGTDIWLHLHTFNFGHNTPYTLTFSSTNTDTKRQKTVPLV